MASGRSQALDLKLCCRQSSMEMTTPVYSTAGQADAGKMSFPIEEKEGNEPQDLPIPNDARPEFLRCLYPRSNSGFYLRL